jgi:branched-chain amino acid transport system permease protein
MDIDFAYLAITTLTLASIYGLLAIGISIVWASLGMINMAQGFVFTAAGYGAWLAAEYASPNGFVVVAAGIVTGALIGVLIGALAFIPLHDRPNFVVRSLICTLAISLLGTQLLLWEFGPRAKRLPKIFGTSSLHLGDIVLTGDKIGAVLSSIALLLATLLWMTGSRRGLEIRAIMQNPEGAALVGIGVRPTALAVLAVAGALAGLAAVLLSQTYFVSPYGGVTPLVKGLVVALAGGLGSVPGALIAAGLLGLTEALTAALLGGQYVLMTQFGMIIAILLIRPRGIGGLLEATRE